MRTLIGIGLLFSRTIFFFNILHYISKFLYLFFSLAWFFIISLYIFYFLSSYFYNKFMVQTLSLSIKISFVRMNAFNISITSSSFYLFFWDSSATFFLSFKILFSIWKKKKGISFFFQSDEGLVSGPQEENGNFRICRWSRISKTPLYCHCQKYKKA